VGATCASPLDCIRTSTEFKGYEAPPAKAVIIFIVVALVLMAAFVCCLWCCFAVWDRRRLAALKSRIEARRRQQGLTASGGIGVEQRGLQLSSMPVSSAFRGSSGRSVQSGGTTVSSSIPGASVSVSTKKKQRPGGGGELRENLLEGKEAGSSDDPELAEGRGGVHGGSARHYAVRLGPNGEAEVALVDPNASLNQSPDSAFGGRPVGAGTAAPIPFPPPLPPLTRKAALLRSCAKCGTVSALLGVLVALIVACLLFPHMPKYSMCNKEIQWGSILTNMKSLQAAVDVDLHVAVWNPNRWALHLRRVDARILYHKDIVGTGSKSDLKFSAGGLSDFLLTVVFAPTVSSATSMLRDHLSGQLLLDVLFDIDAAVLISNFDNPVLALNTSYVMSNIDAEGLAQREYCKCVEPDVNAPNPLHTQQLLIGDSSRSRSMSLASTSASATEVPRIGARVQQQQAVLRPRFNVRTTFTTRVEDLAGPSLP
jgi:hypothetical protein